MTPGMTCKELKQKLENQESIIVIDVREDFEREACHIETSIHIPLGELEERLDELDPNKSYVIQCRSGARSARATEILLDAGFKDVKNLIGGMNQWLAQTDPTITQGDSPSCQTKK